MKLLLSRLFALLRSSISSRSDWLGALFSIHGRRNPPPSSSLLFSFCFCSRCLFFSVGLRNVAGDGVDVANDNTTRKRFKIVRVSLLVLFAPYSNERPGWPHYRLETVQQAVLSEYNDRYRGCW